MNALHLLCWTLSLLRLSPVPLHVDPTWMCYALVKTPTLGISLTYARRQHYLIRYD